MYNPGVQTPDLHRRFTEAQKYAKDKQWFKDHAQYISNSHGYVLNREYNGVSDLKSMKVNYDLYNNILDTDELSYVCNPYGKEAGETAARMINRDIFSSKIKVMEGKEKERALNYTVMALNSEATTRREQEEFKRVRDYAISTVMQPIREAEEQKAQEEAKGRELTPEELQQMKQKVEEAIRTQTPQEVKRYMTREHQDPAEMLAHHLLEYFKAKLDLKYIFNEGWKHLLLSAREIFYVGEFNGEPDVLTVNPMRFSCSLPPDSQQIEDADYASCEYRMPLYKVINMFGEHLTKKEIDNLYNELNGLGNGNNGGSPYDDLSRDYSYDEQEFLESGDTVRVIHCVWKSLREVKFLTYLNQETGEEEVMLVDPKYELSIETGDIKVESEFLVEVYEAWRLGEELYTKMRPIPGQFKDMDKLYECKLPYYGAICDNTNSLPTSLADRLRVFQYHYNIIWYRLDILLSKDKGKKLLMDIKAIPDSYAGNYDKWFNDFERAPVTFVDFSEEGSTAADFNGIAKEIDLSLMADINSYVALAQHIKQLAGEAVGITAQVEGQMQASESVGNTRQSIIQTSYILEGYHALHDKVKRNVLQGLLECAKVAYSKKKPQKLSYVLDDVDRAMFDFDPVLLENSTLGIFIQDSTKIESVIENLKQLSHAALQNQQINMSDVITIFKQKGIGEMEEVLKASENEKREEAQAAQQQQQQADAELAEKAQSFAREKWEHEKDMARLESELKKEEIVISGSLQAASFNPDQDADNDGVNDFVELARDGLDADIKRERGQLDRDKLNQSKIEHTDKMKLEREKLKVSKQKGASKA